MRKLRKLRGFTLIELLAVIIILAIVSVIVTPRVLDVIEDSKKQGEINSVYGVISGAEQYYAESFLKEEQKSKMNGTYNVIPEIEERMQGQSLNLAMRM